MRTAERYLVVEAAAVGHAAYMASWRLSQRLSPLSAGYRKLPPMERLEWDGRMPSTLHALVITAAAAYLFLLSPAFSADHAGDAPFILRTSPASDAALGFSLGYFSTDLVLLALHYPAFGGVEKGVHHVAALVSVAAAAFQGHGHAYTLALLATEATTPFVNLRHLLDRAGWREHPVYAANGLALVLSWLVARILLFLKFFQHVAQHLDEFQLITPLSRALIYSVPPTLFALNVFWFTKIVKGALKLFVKKKPAGGGARTRLQAAGVAAAAAEMHAGPALPLEAEAKGGKEV